MKNPANNLLKLKERKYTKRDQWTHNLAGSLQTSQSYSLAATSFGLPWGCKNIGYILKQQELRSKDESQSVHAHSTFELPQYLRIKSKEYVQKLLLHLSQKQVGEHLISLDSFYGTSNICIKKITKYSTIQNLLNF